MNNYFKLRDIGEAFDFGIDWDGDRNTIVIDTSKGYSLDGGTTTPVSTPMPTPTPQPAPTPTSTPITGDDSVSMNALVGSWSNLQYIDNGFFWVFGADGSFAYMHVTHTSTGTGSTRWDFASNYMIKGQFRIKGYILEFYNCQVSGNNTLTENLWGGSNEAALKILAVPMSNPQAIDDFYAEFEFNDSLSLRIAPDQSGNFDNDIEYDYGGDNHNVNVPTHIIPSRDWPKSLLPNSIPEYGNGGRIRRIATQAKGEEVLIYIDRTSPAALSNYLDRLLQAGWELYDYIYDDNDLKELREGHGDCSFRKDGSSVGIYEQRNEGGRYLIHFVKNPL